MKLREKKIRAAAAEAGIILGEVRWEPIGQAMEMCGPSGGWTIFEAEPGSEVWVAYHFEDIINQIRNTAAARQSRVSRKAWREG